MPHPKLDRHLGFRGWILLLCAAVWGLVGLGVVLRAAKEGDPSLIHLYIPARMSPACREGIITAASIFKYAKVITSTGSTTDCPCPTGILGSGNHRSHWVAAPGACTSRSAGSTPTYSGRIARTRSLRIVIECAHPIRSAITVAGILGCSRNNTRTCGSTASTNEPFAARRYAGGSSEANAAGTVFRVIPRRRTTSLIAPRYLLRSSSVQQDGRVLAGRSSA
jgi:hypothetical protein